MRGSSLVSSAYAGNLEDVRRLISVARANGWSTVDLANKRSRTRGHAAVGRGGDGHHEVVAMLIAAGATVDLVGPGEGTPLYIAAHNGHHEVVTALIDARANLDLAYENGATPLCAAAFNGHVEVVRLLVRAGADLTRGPSNTGPLGLVCKAPGANQANAAAIAQAIRVFAAAEPRAASRGPAAAREQVAPASAREQVVPASAREQVAPASAGWWPFAAGWWGARPPRRARAAAGAAAAAATAAEAEAAAAAAAAAEVRAAAEAAAARKSDGRFALLAGGTWLAEFAGGEFRPLTNAHELHRCGATGTSSTHPDECEPDALEKAHAKEAEDALVQELISGAWVWTDHSSGIAPG